MTPQGRGQLGGHSSGSACPHPTTKPGTPFCPVPWVCGSVQGGHRDTRPSPCAYCRVWGAGCLRPQPWSRGSWPPKPSACHAHGEPCTCRRPLRSQGPCSKSPFCWPVPTALHGQGHRGWARQPRAAHPRSDPGSFCSPVLPAAGAGCPLGCPHLSRGCSPEMPGLRGLQGAAGAV